MRSTGTTKAAYKTPVKHFSLVRFVPGNKLGGYESEERPLLPLVLTKEDLGQGRAQPSEEDDETTHVSETEEEGEEEEISEAETVYYGEEEGEGKGDGAQPDPLLMLSSTAVSPSRSPPAQLRSAPVKRHIYIVKDSDDEEDGPSELVEESWV
jgi:hypothetical protein